MSVPPAGLTMIRRQDPVFVERVEAGPWKTLYTDMVRELRVTLSSGARVEIAARYAFTAKERRDLMESMVTGDAALSHRFLEKRAFAMQTVLGEVQRKYGAIPAVVLSQA